MQNPQEATFTTVQLGRLVGYSTQQVRDLERLGVIPAAERGANGYRRYRMPHVTALQAYRAMAAALGPVPARRLMPDLIEGTVEEPPSGSTICTRTSPVSVLGCGRR